jgi:hypothetical protein
LSDGDAVTSKGKCDVNDFIEKNIMRTYALWKLNFAGRAKELSSDH